MLDESLVHLITAHGQKHSFNKFFFLFLPFPFSGNFSAVVVVDFHAVL